jgi:hypothetical protein
MELIALRDIEAGEELTAAYYEAHDDRMLVVERTPSPVAGAKPSSPSAPSSPGAPSSGKISWADLEEDDSLPELDWPEWSGT